MFLAFQMHLSLAQICNTGRLAGASHIRCGVMTDIGNKHTIQVIVKCSCLCLVFSIDYSEDILVVQHMNMPLEATRFLLSLSSIYQFGK